MIVPRQAVRLEGTLNFFGERSDRGGIIYRRFCPNRGSGVINANEADPETVIVAPPAQEKDPMGHRTAGSG